jgi:hypothetical protein
MKKKKVSDRRKTFARFELSSLDDLTRIEDEGWLDASGWLYRGQALARWPLSTSLERASARLFATGTEAAVWIEKVATREFRRRLHHYVDMPPPEDDDLEWLAWMQHHGAPTRLQDWTYSPWVAFYFALEGSGKEAAAVWAINHRWVTDASAECIRRAGKSPDYLLHFTTVSEKGAFSRLFLEEPFVRFVAPVNPYRLNERLTIQKGVFLCPGDISRTFEENLQALPDWGKADNLIRIDIHPKIRKALLHRLNSMNMNHATLFPGLDGFAHSLKVYHPLYELALDKPLARNARTW